MKNNKKIIKIIISVALVVLFVWFIFLHPYLSFKNNEKTMKQAAEKYLDFNIDKIPAKGETSTITLKELYRTSFLKEDFYVPYTDKLCTVNKSWVKVRKNDKGKYVYYPFLDCGFLKSRVDSIGPEITLNGDSEITINKGDKFKDPGIKKVKDNTDGNIDVKKVKIDARALDTNKIGKYEILYSASDSFNNQTIVKRTINVVQRLNNTVKNDTGKDLIYKGKAANNYILFSGMLFRIVGFEGDNIKIVAATDIASVNYDGIEDWLDYFYDHIAKSSKKYIVPSKFCTGELSSNKINSNISCKSKTKKRNVYLLSNKEINKSRSEVGDSFLFTSTINWTANISSKTHAWAYKYNFIPYDSSTQFYGFSRDYNFAIRPALVIKGDSLIVEGDGSYDSPYFINDIKRAKADELLSTRTSGEYITYSSQLWRIVDTTSDGYTKVITEQPIELQNDDLVSYNTGIGTKIYNPTEKGNVGYEINKKTGDLINEKYFAVKEIEVPVYKTIAKYGKEIKNIKYKTKFSAPNMYEMFTAPQVNKSVGYWLVNSSQEKFRKYVYSNASIVMYDKLPDFFETSIRPVGYFDKNIKIVSGTGTRLDPYKISK